MSAARGSILVLRPQAVSGSETDLRVLSAVRHAGESVDGAVRRTLREAGLPALEPWAVDLSGKRAVLGCDVPDTVDVSALARADLHSEDVRKALRVPRVAIGFRPMSRADLPDVVRWAAAPHVARWWNDEAVDLAAAEKHYGLGIDGTEPTRHWVAEVNGRSVGFLQDYLIGDHPEYALLTAAPEAVGFDYAIGDPAWVGDGLGTRLLWQFLRDVVRPHYPAASTYFAAPDHRNAVSLRVLDKLGFKQGLWFDEPQPNGNVDTCVGCSLKVKRVLGRQAQAEAEAEDRDARPA